MRNNAPMPPGKTGNENATSSLRLQVSVSAPQNASTLPVRTAANRSAAPSGTHSTFNVGSPNWAFTASATFWHSATENPAAFPDGSRNENGRASG